MPTTKKDKGTKQNERGSKTPQPQSPLFHSSRWHLLPKLLPRSYGVDASEERQTHGNSSFGVGVSFVLSMSCRLLSCNCVVLLPVLSCVFFCLVLPCVVVLSYLSYLMLSCVSIVIAIVIFIVIVIVIPIAFSCHVVVSLSCHGIVLSCFVLINQREA
jgi:hypothetical protein